jgi:hypothetical protein
MAEHRTPDELLQHYTDKMGRDLGAVFFRLWNDNAWLHSKWNEFVSLFAKSPAQMRDLNTAAPAFFSWVQDLGWHDILLHIARMTENRPDVLSIYTLLRNAPVGIRDELKRRIDIAVHAAAFTDHPRNLTIAHRNKEIALDQSAQPLTLGSRNDVRAALKTLDDVFDFLELRFCGGGPHYYQILEPAGGVNSLLDVIDRGLKSRDEQFGYFRHPHPPDEPA